MQNYKRLKKVTMSTNKKTDSVENVDRALSSAEQFIEDNQKSITTVIAIILGVIAIFVGIKKLYIAPKELEAQSQMFYAQKYFEIDSMNLALYGDGNNLGFLDIIDNYGITKSANLAKYYAGICYLHQGNFDDAIEYLEKYKKKDELLASVAYGATGDAYVEQGNFDKGLHYYNKAIGLESNKFTTPIYLMKAGGVYEELGEYEQALEIYNRIKKDFGETDQARTIDKYIARAEALKSKE